MKEETAARAGLDEKSIEVGRCGAQNAFVVAVCETSAR
jgi:hypothetical protein